MKEGFFSSVFLSAKLNWKGIIFISVSLAVCAALVPLLPISQAYPSLFQSIRVSVVVFVCLLMVKPIAAVLQRLLDIMRHRTAARPGDLLLIAFTYLFLIVGFAVLYAGLKSIMGREVFYFVHPRARFELVDYLYLSGVTITTVGYGDISPAFWFTKVAVVIQSLIGLWLTATVLGFFIGSLLSRQQQDREARWFADFQGVYFDILNKSAEAISSMESLTPEQWDQLERQLLENIANIVSLQYDPLPSAKVSANWMQLYKGTDAPPEYLQRAQEYSSPHLRNEAAMKTVWGILVLRKWGEHPAGMPGDGELVLPVYDPADADLMRSQLPGAPLAITSSEGYDIVSDVTQMDLINQDVSVQEKLQRYFREHVKDLKSFASVRVGFPNGDTLGAINIQSSEPELCGTTPEEQRIIVEMIRPFAGHLATLQINKAKITKGNKNGENTHPNA